MAEGTLPIELFRNYLVQDYLYLVSRSTLRQGTSLIIIQIHFARANALAAYKSTSMDAISAVGRSPPANRHRILRSRNLKSAQIVLHIEREMSLHLDYCQQFGLSRSDIEIQKESLGNKLRSISYALTD